MKNNIKYYTLALLGLLIFAPTFASAATPSRPSTQDIAVYLIGDSTVDFYPASRYPLTGWGMPFGDSFQPNVRVLNHAESGRSTRTFISDGRWQTVVNALRIADYVLIQFGHNDEVTGGRAYTSPADYKTNLIKFVTETRAKQAIPVLITPVSRRSFSGNTAVQSHPIYSPIVRSVAAEHNVILIDLDSLSIALNQQYGPEGAKALYLYTSPGQYPAYPNGIKDNNHFSAFGAWKIADLVLADLKRMDSELVAHQLAPINTPPVANNDAATTLVNTAVLIPVLANDTAANGNPIDPTHVKVERAPSNGVATALQNGQMRYTPKAGFVGTDSFTYTVEGARGTQSNPATVTVGVNAAPTANAGPDQNAVTGQPVTLDGSASSDPSGDVITFSWRFLSIAPGSSLNDASIVNPNTPAPSFTPDVDGAYELELLVSDGTLSDIDTVIVTAATANAAPNADAGPNQTAEVNQLVTLNGLNSTDPDNGPNALTFQWALAQVPLGSALTNADITNATSPQASFTPDVIGLYRLTLTVFDGDLSDSDDVDIDVTQVNVPPNADAGADVVVQLGDVATLNGSASNDPDNFPNPLIFQWSFVSVAAGSALTNGDIIDGTTPTPSFTPDQPGMYTLELAVFDGSASDSDQVMVTVGVNAAPTANAGLDQNAVTGQPVTLDGSASSHPNDTVIVTAAIANAAPVPTPRLQTRPGQRQKLLKGGA